MARGGPVILTVCPHVEGIAGEPAVAPDRGGITVFLGSTSHQPPRQVNGGVRPLCLTDYLPHHRGTLMPNGGLDNCGVCGFNRANEGVWGREDYTSDERLDNAFCTIRGVEIPNAL